MCGIAGGVNINFSQDFLQKILYHRGPDESDYFQKKNIYFYHTRLAIQDIKQGKQPFYYPNKNKPEYVIIFNGEIYNHIQIRKEYLKDCTFKTNSDTETLLQLYIKFYKNMFDKIDGMFAFAVLDLKRNCIFISKDRAGKKPLYYYHNNDKFFFASELNAFKFINNLQIDNEAIYSYLRIGFFPFEYTPYKKVKKLPQSSYLIYNLESNSVLVENYFNILDFYEQNRFNKPFHLILDKLENNLNKSIKDRLLSSDLEVGAFLSGGIDSSLIVAFASQFTSKLKTFTVKFEDEYDESPLAKLTALKYNTDHTEIEISMDLKNDIEKILVNYGMPFMDSSAIPSYYVSREAKKYLTVILNGDGADELFGGYRRYVPVANNILKLAFLFKSIKKLMPAPTEKKSFYNYIFRLLSMSGKKGLDFYLSSTVDIFEDVYEFEDNNIFVQMENFISTVYNNKNLTDLSKFLYLDFVFILFSDLLIKMDIATMANSLEARSPFLSKYLLEFTPQIPDNLKINKFTTKFILRKLAEKYLPEKLINQPKRGFEVPLKKWIDTELKEMIFDSLTKGCYSENFINRKFIDNLLYNKTSVSKEKRAKMLWTMFSLEVWRNNI